VGKTFQFRGEEGKKKGHLAMPPEKERREEVVWIWLIFWRGKGRRKHCFSQYRGGKRGKKKKKGNIFDYSSHLCKEAKKKRVTLRLAVGRGEKREKQKSSWCGEEKKKKFTPQRLFAHELKERRTVGMHAPSSQPGKKRGSIRKDSRAAWQ